MSIARISQTGLGVSYQDAGRQGWRRFGVPSGGVMDGHSASLANQLLENASDSTVLEFTLHGAEIHFLSGTWVALTGACSCHSLESGSARRVSVGETLKLQPSPTGIWSYLAIPGGWKARTWFGSSSTHSRSTIGQRIKDGDLLASTSSAVQPFDTSVASRFPRPDNTTDLSAPPDGFPILPGPQYEDFPASSHQALVTQKWRVSPRSDRSGYRLEGTPLALASDITSEAVLPGSFQVPGNGQPIITMPDGPTVGGYPKIAYMEPSTLWRLAQCQPGSQIKFRWEK